MKEDRSGIQDVRSFWNDRAQLGEWAGTRDVIAKQLEIEAIAKYVHNGQRILDVGCGNGITAIEIGRRYKGDITGIDFAEEMVMAARDLAEGIELKGAVKFEIGEVRKLPELYGKFDIIYTERTLINLNDWETQKDAIKKITGLLTDGGQYLMCENSQDGLDMINSLRERIGLPTITPPWHNRYFRDSEIEQCNFPGVRLEGVDFHSSTYYFLSRIVNAWLAAQEGKDPDYDSPINRLALHLPSIGKLGQGRIWVWRKVGD